VGIEIHRQFFKNGVDVLDDLKATGFWPTTLVSGPSPGREVHWHSHDVHAYVMEGHTSFLDAESGERHPVEPGDKIVVPPRTLHTEGEVTDRVVYIIAAPDALPWDEFLKTYDPNDL
jgi:mannose-6-phosphate isomerase-like protein (cupin superfamily)